MARVTKNPMKPLRLRMMEMDYDQTALGEALEHRAGGMAIGGVFFTNQHGLLGMTPGAAALMERHRISPPEWEGEKGSSDKV